MQCSCFRLSTFAVASLVVAGAAGYMFSSRVQAAQQGRGKAALIQGFAKGAWDHKAIGPLAIAPGGVLFFADDQAGAIYGVDLMETRSQATEFKPNAELGATIAAKMGTTPAGIQIKDTAFSNFSKSLYLSVRKTDGADQNPANPANYALFRADADGKVSQVDLSDKSFGKVTISALPRFGRRNTPDTRVIGDIAFARGRILVSALATDQFNSNLVSVPVPFSQAGVERYATSIFHVSHKKMETASPIQTLTVYRDADKEYLIAAYVCTPIVRFNLDELKAGQPVTGTTVAELGSGNQPMQMIAYGRAGEQSLLLNNSSFGILKVDGKIAKETQNVNEKTTADRGNGGKTPFAGIETVENLKGATGYAAYGTTLLVVKPSGSGIALETMPTP